MNFGPQTKSYSAHIDKPELPVYCKLMQVHMPRGSFRGHSPAAMLREEFRLSKLTFHSDLRYLAASRRALPRTSSLFYYFGSLHVALLHVRRSGPL